MSEITDRINDIYVRFESVDFKKEIKNENLDVSSGSILSLLEVLRKNQQIMKAEAAKMESLAAGADSSFS